MQNYHYTYDREYNDNIEIAMGRYQTTTKYLLEALLPEGGKRRERRMRRKLISELSAQRSISQAALQSAFSRAVKAGLIALESGYPTLTAKGRHAVMPFVAPTLPGSYLMITFDISESDRKKRDHLRLLLKELSFVQAQKSVWVTKFDHRDYLKAEIKALRLEKSVLLYEARQL